MPTAVLEDRSLARALYLEGFTLKEVAQRVNVKFMTLCSWKRRERWDEQPRKQLESKAAGGQGRKRKDRS